MFRSHTICHVTMRKCAIISPRLKIVQILIRCESVAMQMSDVIMGTGGVEWAVLRLIKRPLLIHLGRGSEGLSGPGWVSSEGQPASE